MESAEALSAEATNISATEPVGADELLQPGAAVEVRRRFDRAWARGFQVIDGDGSLFRLRRESDGAVLPVSFPATDLRLARNVAR